MSKRFSRKEIKAKILYKLRRKNCWGGKYKPYTSIVSWIESKVKKDGKRVKGIIDSLVKERYLLAKKRGNTLSLNPGRKREIDKIIDREIEKDDRLEIR